MRKGVNGRNGKEKKSKNSFKYEEATELLSKYPKLMEKEVENLARHVNEDRTVTFQVEERIGEIKNSNGAYRRQ